MAKIKILGDTMQLKSNLTKEQVLKVKRFKPEVLKLTDKEGNETFAVDVGPASLSKYGVSFGNEDEAGKLYVTINCTEAPTKCTVAEHFATVIRDLMTVEAAVNEADDEITNLENSVMDSIEVVG